jgi:hypothetical protein
MGRIILAISDFSLHAVRTTAIQSSQVIRLNVCFVILSILQQLTHHQAVINVPNHD